MGLATGAPPKAHPALHPEDTQGKAEAGAGKPRPRAQREKANTPCLQPHSLAWNQPLHSLGHAGAKGGPARTQSRRQGFREAPAKRPSPWPAARAAQLCVVREPHGGNRNGTGQMGQNPPQGPRQDTVVTAHTHLQCGHCRPRLRHRHRCWPRQPPRRRTVCHACRGQEHSVSRRQSVVGQPEGRDGSAQPSSCDLCALPRSPLHGHPCSNQNWSTTTEMSAYGGAGLNPGSTPLLQWKGGDPRRGPRGLP